MSRTGLRKQGCFHLALIIGGICWLLTGCVTIDPLADFERASESISRHTGADDAYDPNAETLVEAKIAALVVDGLTTEEVVQICLLNNRKLQAMFQEIGASRADVVQSGLMNNPSMSLSLRFPDGGGLSNLTVGFAQQLVDLWQIPVRKQIAEAQLEQTVLGVANHALGLATEARLEAYRLLALQRAEEIASENLKLVERSQVLAQDRFDAGEARELDINLARANVLNVRLNLVSIRRDREMAHASVGRLMGLSRSDTSWELNDAFPTLESPLDDQEALLIAAMSGRPDAQVAASRVHAANGELKRQCLNVFPSVSLGVELERPERRAPLGRKIIADTARTSIANGALTAPSIQSRGQRRAERGQLIDALLGPTLQITLPIWHQNQAQIAKAKFELLRARKEYEDLLDAVARDVDQSLTAARAGCQLSVFYKDEILPQARANVEATRHAYMAGEQSIIVLIQAQKNLIAQEQSYVLAQREYAIAKAELERAVGRPLPLESDKVSDADASSEDNS